MLDFGPVVEGFAVFVLEVEPGVIAAVTEESAEFVGGGEGEV